MHIFAWILVMLFGTIALAGFRDNRDTKRELINLKLEMDTKLDNRRLANRSLRRELCQTEAQRFNLEQQVVDMGKQYDTLSTMEVNLRRTYEKTLSRSQERASIIEGMKIKLDTLLYGGGNGQAKNG